MAYDGWNPGATGYSTDIILAGLTRRTGAAIAGLPAHLQVIRSDGKPSHSLRMQFGKGKASAKKRGK
jgi:hypothetical protein